MRIACLQFAPQVGDVNNNLNRADSVLAKANLEDVEHLDLLVLPELAFTGYDFKSLNHISAYLEPQGSGISSLWARTTALKYNTNVIVGYPERVDVASRWPAGPEYYNSTIVVNRDGETIANYRKSFLYAVDETWALESKDGFFADELPGLGSLAIGICMDINPYKFEAPWHAFEFAYHILEVKANLVVLTMAWVTREDRQMFSQMPEEPDMETLTYWVQRLEPLIRNDSQEEIIVVIANRTGNEDSLTYAGTSAILGIKDGEVKVYGVLGRNSKDLLTVDTDNGPIADLIPWPLEGHNMHLPTPSDVPHPCDEAAAAPPLLQITSTMELSSRNCKAQRERSSMLDKTARRRRPPPLLAAKRGHSPQQHDRFSSPKPSPNDSSDPQTRAPTFASPGQSPSMNSLDTWLANVQTDHGIQPTLTQIKSPSDHNCAHGPTSAIHMAVSPGSAHLPDKHYSLGAGTSLLESPLESCFSELHSPTSPGTTVPLTSPLLNLNLPQNKRVGSPLAARNRIGAYRGHQSPRYKSVSQTQEASCPRANKQSQSVLPSRLASPKSRNASRDGRHMDDHSSQYITPKLAKTDKALFSFINRPNSAKPFFTEGAADGERQGRSRSKSSVSFGQPHNRARTSLSHKRSKRPSSISTEQRVDCGMRNGDFFDEIQITACPSIFADTLGLPQAHNPKDQEEGFSPIAVRPDTDWTAGKTHDRIEKWLLGSRSPADPPPIHRAATPPVKEPENDAKARLWSDLTQLAHELLHTPECSEERRIRHKARDSKRGATPCGTTSSSPVPMMKTSLSPQERNKRFMQGMKASSTAATPTGASPRRATSQENGPLRAIRAPAGPNGDALLDAPCLDSDDELVAEIIFHSHGQPARGHRGKHIQQQQQQQHHLQHQHAGVQGISSPSRRARTIRRATSHQTLRKNNKYNNFARHTLTREASPAVSDASHEQHGILQRSMRQGPVYMGTVPTALEHKLPLRPNTTSGLRRIKDETMQFAVAPRHGGGDDNGRLPCSSFMRVFEPSTPKAMKLEFGSDHNRTASPTSCAGKSEKAWAAEAAAFHNAREIVGRRLHRVSSTTW